MSRRDQFLRLRGTQPHILPSLLRCDFGDLRGELERLESAGVKAIHLDVMDGQFVPNLSFGIPVVAGIAKYCSLPLDVHLMIQTPGKYIDAFYEAGASAISFHIEAESDPKPHLEKIRKLGAAAGIVVNAESQVDRIAGLEGLCDLVLIMSVQAGFGGQSFQPVALEKIRQARSMFGPDVFVQVDGGVNKDTISDCVKHGADLLVVGSGITSHDNYGQAVRELTELSTSAVQS